MKLEKTNSISMKTSFTIYQVDAFSDKIFRGNPAAVVPLNEWIADELMQQIALENNLSETAFFVPIKDNLFHIRWFTPLAEVNLCGHATLASAFVVFNELNLDFNQIVFQSKSGDLKVSRQGDLIELDFPIQQTEHCTAPAGLIEALGKSPKEIRRAADDYLLVFDDEQSILDITPDFNRLKDIEARGVIVTSVASNSEFDFVSRFFGPSVGVNEDPVTGSAHTKLIPYWAKILNKQEMTAKQVSPRGGVLKCTLAEARVLIAGEACLYMKGTIFC